MCTGWVFNGKNELYASDYFDQLYDFAVELIKKVWHMLMILPQKKLLPCKGTPTEPGKESPYRNRSIEENLRLVCRNESWKIYRWGKSTAGKN